MNNFLTQRDIKKENQKILNIFGKKSPNIGKRQEEIIKDK